MFFTKSFWMTTFKQWLQLVSMQSIFLNKTILSTRPQEDMELEQCQTPIQTIIQNTPQMKPPSDQALLTLTDIQVRFSEQETPTWNSRTKELWTALKWWLTKIICLDQSKLLSIIALGMSWILHYGTQQAGQLKRICTPISKELSIESNLTSQSHSTIVPSSKVLEDLLNCKVLTSQWTWKQLASVARACSHQERKTLTIEDLRTTEELSILMPT